jgi:hypothetical protein
MDFFRQFASDIVRSYITRLKINGKYMYHYD